MTKRRRTLLIAVILACLAGAGWTTAATEPVNARAAAIAAFNKRVQDYGALRKKAARGLPPLKRTRNAEEITEVEHALGEAIRAARANARQGDIFARDVTPILREMVQQYYKEHPAVSARKEMLDEIPIFRPAINHIYPEKLAKATMPPDLLKNLPPLPDTIVEYRIVGTYLTLRDVAANLIVDFIPDVLPAAAKKLEEKS
jgi:hypothetical protein